MKSKVKNYLSLIKFSHTIFAMPFAMIGFALGIKAIDSSQKTTEDYVFIFIAVIVCMITARSAAMAFNRFLDRHFDAANQRTKSREIPSGVIQPHQALLFVLFNCMLFVIATCFINTICLLLSPVALFVILFYSYTKRFTALCHLVLGVGLSLAPIGAYLAVTGKFAWLPLLFSFFVICWVSGFDIIYALQDEEFDKSHQLYSIPSVLGKAKALVVSRILHSICVLILLFIAINFSMHWLYWLGAIVFISMILYQQSLVKANDLSRVDLAFMTANGIASVAFAVLLLLEIYFYR